MSDSAGVTLELRHRPVQQRGIERFQLILAAGRKLLATAGLERFTMEDVATTAGVPVGSVYQYFPNKYALVAEIARQDTDVLVNALLNASVVFPSEDWQGLTDNVIRRMAEMWAGDPWRPAVYAAMRSTAATRELATHHNRMIAEAVTKPLAPLTAHVSDAQRMRIALVIVETCQALLHLTVQTGTMDEATLAEVQRLMRAYLRSVSIGTR